MNRHNLIALVGLTFLPLLGGSVQAQYCPVTIKGTYLTNQPYVTKGNITSQRAPAKASLTTKIVLDDLAAAETVAGNYFGPVPFPSGYKLALHATDGDLDGFAVIDQNNNFVLDVSNVITFAFTNNIIVTSGVFGPNNNFTNGVMGEFSITYNQAGISGAEDLAWHITGFLQTKGVGKENSSMVTNVTSSGSMPHAQGNGTDWRRKVLLGERQF